MLSQEIRVSIHLVIESQAFEGGIPTSSGKPEEHETADQPSHHPQEPHMGNLFLVRKKNFLKCKPAKKIKKKFKKF